MAKSARQLLLQELTKQPFCSKASLLLLRKILDPTNHPQANKATRITSPNARLAIALERLTQDDKYAIATRVLNLALGALSVDLPVPTLPLLFSTGSSQPAVDLGPSVKACRLISKFLFKHLEEHTEVTKQPEERLKTEQISRRLFKALINIRRHAEATDELRLFKRRITRQSSEPLEPLEPSHAATKPSKSSEPDYLALLDFEGVYNSEAACEYQLRALHLILSVRKPEITTGAAASLTQNVSATILHIIKRSLATPELEKYCRKFTRVCQALSQSLRQADAANPTFQRAILQYEQLSLQSAHTSNRNVISPSESDWELVLRVLSGFGQAFSNASKQPTHQDYKTAQSMVGLLEAQSDTTISSNTKCLVLSRLGCLAHDAKLDHGKDILQRIIKTRDSLSPSHAMYLTVQNSILCLAVSIKAPQELMTTETNKTANFMETYSPRLNTTDLPLAIKRVSEMHTSLGNYLASLQKESKPSSETINPCIDLFIVFIDFFDRLAKTMPSDENLWEESVKDILTSFDLLVKEVFKLFVPSLKGMAISHFHRITQTNIRSIEMFRKRFKAFEQHSAGWLEKVDIVTNTLVKQCMTFFQANIQNKDGMKDSLIPFQELLHTLFDLLTTEGRRMSKKPFIFYQIGRQLRINFQPEAAMSAFWTSFDASDDQCSLLQAEVIAQSQPLLSTMASESQNLAYHAIKSIYKLDIGNDKAMKNILQKINHLPPAQEGLVLEWLIHIIAGSRPVDYDVEVQYAHLQTLTYRILEVYTLAEFPLRRQRSIVSLLRAMPSRSLTARFFFDSIPAAIQAIQENNLQYSAKDRGLKRFAASYGLSLDLEAMFLSGKDHDDFETPLMNLLGIVLRAPCWDDLQEHIESPGLLESQIRECATQIDLVKGPPIIGLLAYLLAFQMHQKKPLRDILFISRTQASIARCWTSLGFLDRAQSHLDVARKTMATCRADANVQLYIELVNFELLQAMKQDEECTSALLGLEIRFESIGVDGTIRGQDVLTLSDTLGSVATYHESKGDILNAIRYADQSMALIYKLCKPNLEEKDEVKVRRYSPVSFAILERSQTLYRLARHHGCLDDAKKYISIRKKLSPEAKLCPLLALRCRFFDAEYYIDVPSLEKLHDLDFDTSRDNPTLEGIKFFLVVSRILLHRSQRYKTASVNGSIAETGLKLYIDRQRLSAMKVKALVDNDDKAKAKASGAGGNQLKKGTLDLSTESPPVDMFTVSFQYRELLMKCLILQADALIAFNEPGEASKLVHRMQGDDPTLRTTFEEIKTKALVLNLKSKKVRDISASLYADITTCYPEQVESRDAPPQQCPSLTESSIEKVIEANNQKTRSADRKRMLSQTLQTQLELTKTSSMSVTKHQLLHLADACSQIIYSDDCEYDKEVLHLMRAHALELSKTLPFHRQLHLSHAIADAESSSRFKWPPTLRDLDHDFSIAKFQEEFLEIIPDTWNVVSLTLNHDHTCLYLTRFEASEIPLTIRVPLLLSSTGSGDEDEEPIFSWKETIAKLEEILVESDRSLRADHLEEDQNIRTEWWRNRRELNTAIETLMKNVEDSSVGCFLNLFHPLRPRKSKPKAFEQFKQRFDIIIKEFFETHIPKRRKVKTMKEVFIHDSLLEMFLASTPLPNDKRQDSILKLVNTLIIDILTSIESRLDWHDMGDEEIQLVLNIDSAVQAFDREPALVQKAEPEHTILVLDDDLAAFPWESLGALKNQSIYRLPSLLHLRQRVLAMRKQISSSIDVRSSIELTVDGGEILLNPSLDVRIQDRFRNDLKYLVFKQSWFIMENEEPTRRGYNYFLQRTKKLPSVFIYIGHGSGEQYLSNHDAMLLREESGYQLAADEMELDTCRVALLFGCSSGKIEIGGAFSGHGTSKALLQAGAPAVVGALWDVGDGELNRFSHKAIKKFGLSRKTGVTERDLAMVVAESRESCKLQYLNGIAMVTWGTPVFISKELRNTPPLSDYATDSSLVDSSDSE